MVLMNSVLIASFVLLITGIIDDIKRLKPYYKLIGQFIASLIVVVYGGLVLQDVSFFGLYINFGWFSYVVTIFFILGMSKPRDAKSVLTRTLAEPLLNL